ncbi:MAG: hypothetical protein HS132_04210 [Planctomycetia bacterium]|nr:hypothetical protein [Planctomycetia bacterium]
MDVNVEYFGHILQDQNVPIAARLQKSFVKEYPNTIATSCLSNIASSFLKNDDETLALGIEGYLRRIVNERYSNTVNSNA